MVPHLNDDDFMQRVSTRLAFLAAGMGMAAWAALVPFAAARLELGPARLGLLLLCLGVGSLTAMPGAGLLASRFGCRPIILWSGALGCAVLPALAVASRPWLMAAVLFVFGAAIGTLDVVMNIQAVMVEKHHGSALMSGFHGLFSIGGFVGAGGMALLLWSGLAPLTAAAVVAVLMSATLAAAAPYLLRAPAAAVADTAAFAMPHGAVIFIGALCFTVFLAEGAMLDWSALLLTGNAGLTADEGGLGYAVFAVAMTAGRLAGDGVVRRWGRRRIMLSGGVCTAAGFFIAALVPLPLVALLGFLLIGLGASNIVPILFSAAGRQHDMSASMAISAVTTLGYAGILAGPALIGFVAHLSGLPAAFGVMGCAMLLVALSARSAKLVPAE